MQERSENNKQSQNGWYKHKETGAVVHLVDDPTFGVPLTNAYIKAGFVFVGEKDPREKVVADEPAIVEPEVKVEAPEPKPEPKAEVQKLLPAQTQSSKK